MKRLVAAVVVVALVVLGTGVVLVATRDSTSDRGGPTAVAPTGGPPATQPPDGALAPSTTSGSTVPGAATTSVRG